MSKYTVLSAPERSIIRYELEGILTHLIESELYSPAETAIEFMTLQAIVGENFNSFDAKMIHINKYVEILTDKVDSVKKDKK